MPVQRTRTATTSDSKIIENQSDFNELYRLLFDLSGKDNKVAEALKLLEGAKPSFVKDAKKAVAEEIQGHQESLQKQLDALKQAGQAQLKRLKTKNS